MGAADNTMALTESAFSLLKADFDSIAGLNGKITTESLPQLISLHLGRHRSASEAQIVKLAITSGDDLSFEQWLSWLQVAQPKLETLFSGEHYLLEGIRDPDCVEFNTGIAEQMAAAGWDPTAPKSDDELVAGLRQSCEAMVPQGDTKYSVLCATPVEIELGGSEWHPAAESTTALVHRVLEPQQGRSPCIVYFHGGGGVAGSAALSAAPVNRYTAETKCTIISVNYRLAPETKMPAMLYDAYAALKWILDESNATALKIDTSRVALLGDSGGGYVATGVGMLLGERGEGNLVKFMMPQIPMVGDLYVRDGTTDDDFTVPEEQGYRQIQTQMSTILTADISSDKTNKLCFPNLMSDADTAACPWLIGYTCEFDCYRKMAEDQRDLFDRNNRLLDFGCLRGHFHGSFMIDHLKRTDEWFAAVARVCERYL